MAPVLRPTHCDVSLEDIAISLSRQCRFGGHLKKDVEHYSVAQHCVIVSRACKPEHALVGLLHDAAEAYVQDIIRPLKQTLGASYAVVESAWSLAIGQHFGLGDALVSLPDDVHAADKRALVTERRDLICHHDRPWGLQLQFDPYPETIIPLRAHLAYRLFMSRFEELTAEHPLSVVP